MATLLYRLGKASFRRAKTVLGLWLVGLVAFGIAGFGFGGATDEEFRIPGSESQAAFDRLEAVFPAFAGASAQAVIVAPEGDRLDEGDNRSLIVRMARAIRQIDGIEEVTSPFDEFAGRALSDDAQYAYIAIQFETGPEFVTDQMLDELVATRSLAQGTGVTVEYGGTVFQDQQVGLTISEVFGVAFAGLVLVITFRSFRPAWMPLASAIIGVGIVLGVIFLGAHALTVSSSTPLLAVMLGLAVGIDYSLFILSRHRSQLAAGEKPEESAAMAVGTAGNAVVFAGVTVIIALLGLILVGIPFLSVMGVGAALAVLVAIVAAITLLPALMGLAGESLRPKPSSQAARIASLSAETPSMGRRWVRMVQRRPLVVTVITTLGLGGLALPALSLDLNLPGGGQEPEESTQRKAFDLISEGFGPGYNGPLLIAVDITKTNDILDDLEDIRGELQAIPGIDYVSEGFPSPTLDTGIFQVIPTTAPDSPETKVLVGDLRERLPEIEQRFDTPMAVTGVTAIGVDVSQRIQSALIPFGVVVVGLSIVLLLAVFRSIVVPIKAALGFVLSVTAAFGVVVAVFQWGFGAELFHATPGPILSFMPIILMAVLFGLAMDYEVFLVSGMREQYVHTGNAKRAIEEGYSQGARVVTAAALIMFFVFFAFVPEGTNIIKPIALGLAVGILFDAFVVRMTLVPALMELFGQSAWWIPRRIDRSVPHADVEGEALRDHIRDTAWAATHHGVAVKAEYLVAGDLTYPVSTEWPEGARVNLVGEYREATQWAATLSGFQPPHSGALHVLGHALPGDARAVRRLVSVWSRSNEDVLSPVGDSLSQRLRWSELSANLSNSERRAIVSETIRGLNAVLSAHESPPSARIEPRSIPGLLPRHAQIACFAAIALVDRAALTLISPTDPIADEDERQWWWQVINALTDSRRSVALFCLPPARALRDTAGHVVVDLAGEPRGVVR